MNTTLYAKWTIPDYTDINQDDIVDVLDIALLANHYNNAIGQTNYNIIYDLNKDGIIDIYDLVLVSRSFHTIQTTHIPISLKITIYNFKARLV